MRKIVLGLLFSLLTWPVLAQLPPSSGLVVGNTPVQGGTTGQCLYKNGNVLGAQACSTGSVTTWSGGTTGLLPSSATSGAITVTGTLVGANGGTGVANTGKTITLGGNLVTSGAFNTTLTVTGDTNVTLPTAGTLAPTSSPTFSGTVTMPDGATWTSAGITDAVSYTTASTPIINYTPTWNFSSTSSGLAAFFFNPTFVPTGASAGNINNINTGVRLGTSAVNVSTLRSVQANVVTDAGYSGTLSAATVYTASVSNSGTNAIGAVIMYQGNGTANGNGITSGSVANATFDSGAHTASAAAGGSVTNYANIVRVGTGSGAGTTNNYGVFITGNGGSGGAGTTTNYALYSESTAASSLAGSLALPNIASDAATTNNTVCATTTTRVLTVGSGASGICLGTSSARYKHDIYPQRAGLREISALEPVTFYYNKGYGDDGASRKYGFTAEQVYSVLPDIVGLDGGGVPNTVDWAALVPILVRGMQELKSEIDNLKEVKAK